MKGRNWVGRRLRIILPILMALTILLPLRVYSGGEVVLEQYISKLVVFVGETVTFGTEPIPVPGAVVTWDFGDGSPEVTGWPVTHIYEEAGEYDIRARVVYPSGEEVPTIPTSIRVKATGNTPPVAVAEVSPLETMAGLPITFDAAGSYDPDTDGEISRYHWYFGDGNEAMTDTVEYAYSRAGVYRVVLEVTDNGEMDASTIVTVTINALPTSILPGIDRSIPPPAGDPPYLASLVLVDMGVYEEDRQPFREYSFPIDPPYSGVASSNRSWLVPDPTDLEKGPGPRVVVRERIKVRNTSLLPRAHTNWGQITLIINGRIVEIPVAVTVRGPTEDISTEVWELYEEVLERLTSAGQRSAMVYSWYHTNGADTALGFITEYVIEGGYGGRISREDFVTKVTEELTGEDKNGDGIAGFVDADREIGIKIDE
jgi:PKD repeat protein